MDFPNVFARSDGKNEIEQLQEENEDLKFELWWERADPETKRRVNRRIYLESIGVNWKELEIR